MLRYKLLARRWLGIDWLDRELARLRAGREY